MTIPNKQEAVVRTAPGADSTISQGTSLTSDPASVNQEGPTRSTLDGILADLTTFVRGYCVLEDDQLIAVALWVAHTWVFAASECTPYLAITSSEKRCGKSTLLDTLGAIVARPKQTGGMSPAVLYRVIEKDEPTLLFDEIDTVFGGKGRDERNEELRGLFNAGFRRGGVVQRMGGKNYTEIQDFNVYCPKSFAGIGLHTLPDTVRDRSIELRLRRKKRDEVVNRLRLRHLEAAARPLKDALTAWSEQAVDELHDAAPSLPDDLNDRAQDIWEPLLAIADLAGGPWPRHSRLAAVALSSDGEPEDDSFGVRLLSSIREVWRRRAEIEVSDADRIKTVDLVWELSRDIESPFAEWWDDRGEGKPAPGAAKRLSNRLREYDIHSETLRFQGGDQKKGYRRENFRDAFERYLPSAAEEAENPVVERDATDGTGGTASVLLATDTLLSDESTEQVA